MRFELEPMSAVVTDPTDPHFVEHRKRNRMLINNGIWVPMVGLSACLGDIATMERTIETAINLGYRYIDTSFSPPHEVAIGNAMRRLIMSGRVRRDDLFIATKLPREGNQRDLVKKYLRASLRNLQVNYVDLYLVHFPVRDVPHLNPKARRTEGAASRAATPVQYTGRPPTDILEVWRGMEDAANCGMTRSVGLCNFSAEQTKRILAMATIKPTVLQVECHPYLKQKELVHFCREHQIAPVAYAPLGSPGRTQNVPRGRRGSTPPPLLENPVLKTIAEQYRRSPAQIVIRWLLQRGVMVLPRTTSFEHMRENSLVYDFLLSDTDMKTIGGLNRQMRIFRFDDDKSLLDDPEYPFRTSQSTAIVERKT
ncbi:1,5-anhydro-D-fructose reductase-like [Ornithodoros turicata]|uniref:1,5-anhydro-D-fructose reductase-like n=1 Tax=Ornithodoros turicata TaxID=34597 RepID=UPI003138C79A